MAISLGIRDCKIAPRTAAATWGAVVDVPYVQMMGLTPRVFSIEGTGDDKIAVVGSRLLAGAGQCRMQGVPLAVLAVITGLTVEAVTINTIASSRLSFVGGTRLPAFAIAGLGLNEDDTGDTIYFSPNVKVTGDIVLGSLEYNVLSQIEFPFTALDDGSYGFAELYERDDTDDDLTIPPYVV